MAKCFAKLVQGSPKKYNEKKESKFPTSPRLLNKQKENFHFTKKLSPRKNEVKTFNDDENSKKNKVSENEFVKKDKEAKHSLKETLQKLARSDNHFKNSLSDAVEMFKNYQKTDKLSESPSRNSSDRKSSERDRKKPQKTLSQSSLLLDNFISSKSNFKKFPPKFSPTSEENVKFDENNEIYIKDFFNKQNLSIPFAPLNKIQRKASTESSQSPSLESLPPPPPRQPPPTPEEVTHLPCFVRKKSTSEHNKTSPRVHYRMNPQMQLKTSQLLIKGSSPPRKDSPASLKSTSSKHARDVSMEATHVAVEKKIKRKKATFLEVDHLPLSFPRSTYIRETTTNRWSLVKETFTVFLKFFSDNWREVLRDWLRWPGVVKLLVAFLSIAYLVYLTYGALVASVWILFMWSFIFFVDHFYDNN